MAEVPRISQFTDFGLFSKCAVAATILESPWVCSCYRIVTGIGVVLAWSIPEDRIGLGEAAYTAD